MGADTSIGAGSGCASGAGSPQEIRSVLSTIGADLNRFCALVSSAKRELEQQAEAIPSRTLALAFQAIVAEEDRLERWAGRLRELEQARVRESESHSERICEAERAVIARASELTAREAAIDQMASDVAAETERLSRQRASLALARARNERAAREMDAQRAELDRRATELADLQHELDQGEAGLA